MKFFKNLQKNGVLNNTVVFFGGDHGAVRDYEYMKYRTGNYESKLPAHYVIVPPWFRERHKKEYSALKLNGNHRLTSHFDLYTTLQYLLNKGYTSNSRGVEGYIDPSDIGVNLFTEISQERTCEKAGIHAHFCACGSQVSIPNTDPRAFKAGQLLINGINSILEETHGKCVRYEKFSVTSAYVMLPSQDIMVSIRTRPAQALLRSTVQLNGGKITLFGLERLEAYAPVTQCLADHHDRALANGTVVRRRYACICKDVAHTVMEK